MERRNSIIDKDTNLIDFAKKIGISYNSYKKYADICTKLGIIRPYGEHTSVIALNKVIETLSIPTVNKHVGFFRKVQYEAINFNTVYKTIVDNISLNNFKQQDYNIKKKRDLLKVSKLMLRNRNIASPQDRATVKQISKDAAYHQLSTSEYCERILFRDKPTTPGTIVTGKYHLSSLLGMSPTSGSNALKRLVKEGKVTRTVVKTSVFHLPYTNSSFELLVSSNASHTVVPSSYHRSFSVYKGSAITLLTPTSLPADAKDAIKRHNI